MMITNEQILELATYYSEKGKNEWSGTDSSIVKFANAIRDKLLKTLIVQLEGELQ